MSLPAWWRTDPSGPFRLGPRDLPGRIWTASGCFGYGLQGHDVRGADLPDPYVGVGLVVTKTLTAAPRAGNPMPRLCELPWGALNSIGLENVGLSAFLEEILPELARRRVQFIVSLAATRPGEFAPLVRQLVERAAAVAGWHGVELNLSCPNVAEGGLDFGRSAATVNACVRAARPHLDDRVLLAKLTPNTDRLAPLAVAAREGGADGVVAINTVLGLEVDLVSGRPVLPRRVGGYSGAGIRPIALARVDEIVRGASVPVIGVGGIQSAEDALRFFALGAVAVQVGTAQMRDPLTAARIAAALRPADSGKPSAPPR
jgi:dihydroorotate dehydrogenase (NAD+) catalytic subunit